MSQKTSIQSATLDEYKQLARLRVIEAKCLFLQGYNDGAYYLAGYAIECVLKAILINTLLNRRAYPDYGFKPEKFYTHDLESLLIMTPLKDVFFADPSMNMAWNLLKDWSEQSRYSLGKTSLAVESFLTDVEDTLKWLLQHC